VKRHALVTAVIVSALGLSAVVFRAESVEPKSQPQPRVAASQTCTTSTCHAREDRWMRLESGGREHFASMERLRTARASSTAYARAVQLVEFEAPDGMCVRCHGTDVAPRSLARGVGCEGCHGPASGYRAFHEASPGDYAGAVQRGLRDLRGKPQTWIGVCADCHYLAGRAEYRPLIGAGHPSGASWDVTQKFTILQGHWRASYTTAQVEDARRRRLFDTRSGGGGRPPTPTPPAAAGSAPPTTGDRPAGKLGGLSGGASPAAPRPMPDFPWPPPEPSAQTVLADSLFRPAGRPNPSLSSVAATLVAALERARYSEYSYYRAPNGFALVARLERIDPDGTPMPEAFRFLLPGSTEPFSIGAYVKRLFFAPTGFYRQIVFAVTDQPFTATGARLDAAGAARLLSGGANSLAREFDRLPFTDGHRVTALIYEFRKGTGQGDVATLTPSRLGARTHLDKSGIYPALSVR